MSDEQPHCLRARYRERLSEGADPGSYVLTVLASDSDLDPKLKYYLTGDGAEHFALDRDTGCPSFVVRILHYFFYHT